LKEVDILNKPIKLLGNNLDEKLSWVENTNQVYGILSRVLYLLCKLQHCVTEKMLPMAYHAFFQCHIYYGAALWGNSVGAADVLIVQKRH
jgi:hypothetical protein